MDATLTALAALAPGTTLRFTNHWPDDDEKPALLAAALMGPLRSRHFVIDASDSEAVDGMLRFGVATALSRRDPALTDFVGLAARLDALRLYTLWTPGSRDATEALFARNGASAGGASGSAAAYGPLHATFVSPHVSSGADGHPDVVFLVRRWLTRRLREDHEIAASDVRSTVAAVGLVVEELVSNVQEHAAGPHGPAPDCLMRLSLASPHEVRCSVIDTGVGLVESLRSKVPARSPGSGDGSPEQLDGDAGSSQLVTRLIAGDLPGWNAGRGVGLARVTKVIRERAGRMTLASGTIRVSVNGGIASTSDGFHLQGTVVDCTVPTAAP